MEEEYRKIIVDGFKLIQDQKFYRQVTVINKLDTLGISTSTATFNRILNNIRVGGQTLLEIATGMEELIAKELGFTWRENSFIKQQASEWSAEIIPEINKNINKQSGFIFHEEGRLSTTEKIRFITDTKKEIIEFGITLNSFSSYFYNRKSKEFKVPILELLNKGVSLKCYLLDPNCNAARFYFEDRKSILLDNNGEEKIRTSIKRLQALRNEINLMNLKGSIHIYTYKHIPNNYFLAIDSEEKNGKMMVSHYLYGERRADCPVFEFTKRDNPQLYKLYKSSLNNLISNARLLE